MEIKGSEKNTWISLVFPDSNKVIPEGEEKLEHKSNYFMGIDSSKWKSDVPNYEKVIYRNIYDNIDLVYYSSEYGLKYDWVVASGGDPSNIQERFMGATSVKINGQGGLIITSTVGKLIEAKPYSYQIKDGLLQEINIQFDILDQISISYNIIDYDPTLTLIIDPLIYSTFVGGSDTDKGYGGALDALGNVYVTGDTESNDFPTTSGAYDTTYNSGSSPVIFVFKLNNLGTDLIYSTYVGADINSSLGRGIAVDLSGNAYVAGQTSSPGFPTTEDAYDTTHNGKSDIVVFKLNSDGSNLIFSTFVGGTERDTLEGGNNIKLDPVSSDVFIVGNSFSQTFLNDFPTTEGAYDETYNGRTDIVVFKLSSDGSNLIYSTYVGGSNSDVGWGISLDVNTDVYITGNTKSPDFPVTFGAFDMTYNGCLPPPALCHDAIVFKLSSDGSELIYSTYVGGIDGDGGMDIEVDIEGNAYIVGTSLSVDFPTTPGAYDDAHNGLYDVILFKLNNDGTDLIYSTFIGGSQFEAGLSLVIDPSNNAYITGMSDSLDFPVTLEEGGLPPSGREDVINLKLNFDGSELIYSSLVGGDRRDEGWCIVLDQLLNPVITGKTYDGVIIDFPTTPGAYDNFHNGEWDVFVFKDLVP
uniref:Cell surface glycoprotein (S-layer protein) related protein n=1 Tax=uncultured marine group II/III euryarchaeote KM3_148_H03 TaxID=1457883 RepID=A0A075GIT6_9EURY|nr:cell surface glycoprotein (s-layer protein) related protein [uncultured marine group II/III euryarchaeote KM3_148_H03]